MKSDAAKTAYRETEEDAELARVLEGFLADVEAGQAADPNRLITEHPPIADRLRACLGSLQFVALAAGQTSSPFSSQNKAPLPGMVGDFRIRREIARGGMGVVYEAEQVSLRRRVALKVLPFAAVLDPKRLQRFKNEAQAAAALDHPNIVSVHSVGCDRGVHYYAMQYIEGQTLAQIIDELRQFSSLVPRDEQNPSTAPSQLTVDLTSGRLAPSRKKPSSDDPATDLPAETPALDPPPDDTDRPPQAHISTEVSTSNPEFFRAVARLGIQAAEALEHAHQMGVVHRDIKPSNLMVDAQGHLWVTDFGLAMTRTETNLTLTGDILGTLRYMSPEQVEAKHGVLDHRTDVYSLGLTLYELLALRPAFPGDDRQSLMRQIADDDPRPPREFNDAIPRDLETIVLKATAKEPQARYATAQALADDLGRFVEDKPIRARRPSLPERARKWTRRHQAVVWSAVVLMVMLTLGLVISTLLIAQERSRTARAYEAEKGQREEAQAQEQLAKEQQRRAEKQRSLADGRELAVRRLLYAAQMKLAYQAWRRGNHNRLLQLVERYLPAAGQEDLRRFEWYYLWGLCHQELHVLNNTAMSPPAFSPDGKVLATPVCPQGLVRLWDPRTGRVLQNLQGHRGCANCVAFSPDGTILASGGGGSDEPGEVILWDAAMRKPLATLEAGPVGIGRLAFSPDGTTLATGSSGGFDAKDLPGGVTLWDVATRQPRLKLREHHWGVSALAFAPDGQTLVSGCWDGEVILWDASEGKELATIRPRGHVRADADHVEVFSSADIVGVFSVAFSPDGTVLALANPRNMIELWDMRTRTRRKTLKAREHGNVGNVVFDVAFSPDGGSLAAAYMDGTVRLWDVATNAKTATFIGHTNWAWGVAFSPDGKTLASAGRDKTIRLWDVTTMTRRLPKGRARSSPSPHPLGGRTVLALAGNAQVMALVTQDNGVLLWDTVMGQERFRLKGTTNPVWSVAFSPDGNTLATASGSASGDGTVKLWDVATGQERKRLGEPGFYTVVAFSPDGEHVAAVRGKTVMVWDLTTGTYRTTSIEGHEAPISCLAFSPNGELLATASFEWQYSGIVGVFPSEVRLWELRTGQLRRRFSYILRACDITFSPDGTTLAVCGGNWFENFGSQGKVQLFDVRTGQELTSLEAQSQFVTGVAFSPSGKTLATGSYDGSVKLWETNTWQERATLDWNGQQIDRVVFSTDGRTLAASSAEGGVKLWRTPSAEEVEDHTWLIWSRRGQQHESQGQWDEAVESYTKAIARKPDNWRCWFDRGDAYAELEKWPEAAADFSKAIDLGLTSGDVWYRLALVHLMRGDRAAVRRTCAGMLERLGHTTNLRAVRIAAWTCSLAPDVAVDLTALVALATKAAEAKATYFSYRQTLGAILYRDGQFEEALKRLKEAEQLAGESCLDPTNQSFKFLTPVTGWFYLAMAHYRLGDDDEAQRWLRKAVDRSKTWLRENDDQTGPTVPWYRRAVNHLLRQEAEELMHVPADRPGDPPGELPKR